MLVGWASASKLDHGTFPISSRKCLNIFKIRTRDKGKKTLLFLSSETYILHNHALNILLEHNFLMQAISCLVFLLNKGEIHLNLSLHQNENKQDNVFFVFLLRVLRFLEIVITITLMYIVHLTISC